VRRRQPVPLREAAAAGPACLRDPVGGRRYGGNVLGYAVVDVETTGFSPRTDRIVEIAIVLLDPAGNHEDEWSTLVNPLRGVGPSWVHGIGQEDVAEAPTFSEVAPHVMAALAGRTFVAHNAAFDLRFVSTEMARAGLPLGEGFPALCTMQWSRTFVQAPTQKLVDCCLAAGVELVDAHAALGDARATAGLLAHYLHRCGGRVPWDAVVRQCDAYPWPLLLHDDGAAAARALPRPLGAVV